MKIMLFSKLTSIARSKLMVSALCLVILAGCRTAPDMRPFVDATAQLSGSIKTAGSTVLTEVDSMSSQWKDTQRNAALGTAKKFQEQWVGHQKLGTALVEYSTSLAAIVEAGEQGEKSARAVSDSFKKLTDAVGVAFPQAAAAGVAVNVASHLYGLYSRDHAAKTLGESMRCLQPAIDETAQILEKSFKDVEDGLDAVRDQVVQNSEDALIGNDKVTTKRGRLKKLLARRAELLDSLSAGTASRDSLRADLSKSADASKEQDFTRLTKLMTDITVELAAIESSISTESESLKPVDAQETGDHKRLSTTINLIRTARGGLQDWAAAHARLAAAALEKKPPQVEDLVQTASDIRELIKTVRAGQNP